MDAKANILLVDDRPSNLVALKAMLEQDGHELVLAGSGEEALRRLLKQEFAVILLDVQMPELDGFETASMIRSRDRTSYTPIIFLTAHDTDETHVTRGYELGAVDYIFKPIVPEILRAKVRVFVELLRKTEQVKRQAELERSHAELELRVRERAAEARRLAEREKMQRDFVAHVSHELRTPIAAIKGYAETLRCGAMDDLRRRLGFVKTIERHADRLGALVEDLLTIGALERGRAPCRPGPVRLAGLVSRYVASVGPLSRRKGIAVSVEAPRALVARADEDQVTQVLQNLIDNAIKYNRPGGMVEIEARAEGAFARVDVRDTGIGIAPGDLPLLFTRFHRTDAAKAMNIGGTGLGLYIVKTIVESNGGRIWAESAAGKGSTFSFILPLHKGRVSRRKAADRGTAILVS